jgi:hypothetical protein
MQQVVKVAVVLLKSLCFACCCWCHQDNLMPLTCRGQNWQGGLALTLVDSLDTLALMNR